jgi:hypothetical protein
MRDIATMAEQGTLELLKHNKVTLTGTLVHPEISHSTLAIILLMLIHLYFRLNLVVMVIRGDARMNFRDEKRNLDWLLANR